MASYCFFLDSRFSLHWSQGNQIAKAHKSCLPETTAGHLIGQLASGSSRSLSSPLIPPHEETFYLFKGESGLSQTVGEPTPRLGAKKRLVSSEAASSFQVDYME